MKRFKWRTWLRPYILPFALMALSFWMVVLIGAEFLGAEEPDMFWLFVVMPVLSILIGFFIRPANVIVVPIAFTLMAILVSFSTQGIADALAMAGLIVLVFGLPMTLFIWLGKAISSLVDAKVFHDGDGPRAPA